MKRGSVFLSIIMISTFVSFPVCDKDNTTESNKDSRPDYLVGPWKLNYVDIPDRYSGDPVNMGWHSTVTLEADGDYVETGVLWNGPYTITGTWSASNTEIHFHGNRTSYYAPYGKDGDNYTFTITVTEGNVQDLYIFRKQD